MVEYTIVQTPKTLPFLAELDKAMVRPDTTLSSTARTLYPETHQRRHTGRSSYHLPSLLIYTRRALLDLHLEASSSGRKTPTSSNFPKRPSGVSVTDIIRPGRSRPTTRKGTERHYTLYLRYPRRNIFCDLDSVRGVGQLLLFPRMPPSAFE